MTKQLVPGDSAPRFYGNLVESNPRFLFDKMAGRPIVLLFLGGATWPGSDAALRLIAANRSLFDDQQASIFGITIDSEDVAQQRLRPQRPGIRFFDDSDRAISTACGVIGAQDGQTVYRRQWVLLDHTLRILACAGIDHGQDIVDAIRAYNAHGYAPPAPVLVVPRVFDADTCRTLIDLFDRHGGRDSGSMDDVDGKTVERVDHQYKKRSDYHIDDPALQADLSARIERFLLPQIKQAFQFDATRLERFMVGCYDSDGSGGRFMPHRDDVTPGTAHRRFACTINLNAEDYEGGDLCFPEFGQRLYRAPTGGAVIFSCSMLHEVKPMIRGRRYAFLPFLYDEAGSVIRDANAHTIVSADGATAAATTA